MVILSEDCPSNDASMAAARVDACDAPAANATRRLSSTQSKPLLMKALCVQVP